MMNRNNYCFSIIISEFMFTGSLPGHHQQPLDNVKKCKNFLSTLIKLAASQPEQTVKNVRELIQGLIVSIFDT